MSRSCPQLFGFAFTRRLSLRFAGLILLGFLLVGLYPFRWAPPRQLGNGAVLRDDESLAFPTAGIAYASKASDWINSAIRSNSFEVQLRVKSFQREQSGPARIFSVSRSLALRNITIGQSGEDLVVRLRTPATSTNGIPEHTIESVFANSDWRDILVVVRSGTLIVSVDEEVRLRQPVPSQPLSTWDPSYELVFGNELNRNRPWLGEICEVKVRADEWQRDYLRSGAIHAPHVLWNGFKLQLYTPPESFALDVTLNFLCFVPFGFTLAFAWRRWGFAALACATISLSVEFLQLFVDTRMPSVSDWVSNSLGGIVGALCAYFVYCCYRRERGRARSVMMPDINRNRLKEAR